MRRIKIYIKAKKTMRSFLLFLLLCLSNSGILFSAAADHQNNLLRGIMNNHPQEIINAVRDGAYIDKPDDNKQLTPLYRAAQSALSLATLTLLNLKASPSIRSPKGFTPLSAACNNPKTSEIVIAALMEAQASPYDLGHEGPSIKRETAFMDAAYYCKESIADQLLYSYFIQQTKQGKKIAETIEDYTGEASPAVHFLFRETLKNKTVKDLLNHTNSVGETALIRVFQGKKEESTSKMLPLKTCLPDFFISLGADPRVKDRYGNGIVELAVEQGNPKYLEVAILSGAPIGDLQKLIKSTKERHRYLNKTNTEGKNLLLLEETHTIFNQLTKLKYAIKNAGGSKSACS